MDVQLEIPELQVAEYHRPYVAVWLESDKGRHQRDLAVWYDHTMRNNEGNKWLKDLRLWWRRSGRSLDMPVDGFTGATRAPGVHSLELENIGERLESLQPGDYNLVVEAAREVGGREAVRVPLTWPPEATTQLTARGESELGAVTVTLNP
jgi:hypothetical protein